MRKVYLVPNIITTLSLACGLFIIFKMNMTEPGASNYHLLLIAAVVLLIASVADFLDGAVARLVHAESEFGVQFDSLSDAITFGVAPAVVVLKTLSVPAGTDLSFLVTAAGMIYTVCGVLRLVRFNITQNVAQAESNSKLKTLFKKSFTGLPIPAAAIAAVSANLFLMSQECERWFGISDETRSIVMVVVMFILGYFMVSRWKFPSFKSLHVQVKSFHLVFLTVVIAICLLYGALYHFAVVFMAVPWLYFIVGWILSLTRLIAGKNSKTLVEFEPDQEED